MVIWVFVLENNFIASASEGPTTKKEILLFFDIFVKTSFNAFTVLLAELSEIPITILDGFHVSSRADPSLKNSGMKTIFVDNFLLILSVKPIGTVDLIMKREFGLFFFIKRA
jgi:hypothetical protein